MLIVRATAKSEGRGTRRYPRCTGTSCLHGCAGDSVLEGTGHTLHISGSSRGRHDRVGGWHGQAGRLFGRRRRRCAAGSPRRTIGDATARAGAVLGHGARFASHAAGVFRHRSRGVMHRCGRWTTKITPSPHRRPQGTTLHTRPASASATVSPPGPAIASWRACPLPPASRDVQSVPREACVAASTAAASECGRCPRAASTTSVSVHITLDGTMRA